MFIDTNDEDRKDTSIINTQYVVSYDKGDKELESDHKLYK